MGNIASMNQLVAAMPGQKFQFFKNTLTAKAAGTFHSLWMATGLPSAGVTPVANTIPTKATAGALGFTDATGSLQRYLSRFNAAGATIGNLILYDRLWHTSGLSGIVTAADTAVANTALTRPSANATGVELWGEVYTALGSNSVTLNCRYTNQDGTTNQVGTYAHPSGFTAPTVAGQMFPIQLAAGDSSVRAVTAYHWSGTTGVAGNFGFTLLRRVAEIPLTIANVNTVMDAFATGLPYVPNDACLAFMVFCSATSTGIIQGSADFIQG